MDKKIDLPKNIGFGSRYEEYVNSIDSLYESEYINDIKKDRLNILKKKIQIEKINNNIDSINLDTLEKMAKLTTDLGVEIKAALDIEIDKIPETIKDDVMEMERLVEGKVNELRKNYSLDNSVNFAKDYNMIIKDQGLDLAEEASTSIRNTFNKNEQLLLVTDNITIKDGQIGYKDIDYSVKLSSIEDLVNVKLEKIDVLVEAVRKVKEDGIEINSVDYIKNEVFANIHALMSVNLDLENDKDKFDELTKKVQDYIRDKDSYMKDKIPNLNFNLRSILNMIDKDLEKGLANDLSVDKEKGFELDM